MRWLKLFVILFLFGCNKNVDAPFELIAEDSEILQKFFADKDKYEVQIVYTQIDRDEQGKINLNTQYYNYDENRYFYPASTVKMPVAFLALQKLNELGIDKWSVMKTDSAQSPQTASHIDTTAEHGLPTVAHNIERIFAISENDPYNRLYEFLGQDYINQQLSEKGIFNNSRIITRVGISGFSTEDNKYTNPVSFYDNNGKIIYQQDAKKAEGDYTLSLTNTTKGLGYYDDTQQKVIEEPFKMGEKNFINLVDLESSLKRIIFPELSPAEEKFNLSEDDYQFLYWAMCRVPREHPYLQNQLDDYYDSYVKFFINGDSKEQLPDHIKIFNKVGFAYGYLTDCSYVIDTERGIEYFLTATVHVNENKIYNDGKYEYDDGIKFLTELGKGVYNLEKERLRQGKPDLTKFTQAYKIK